MRDECAAGFQQLSAGLWPVSLGICRGRDSEILFFNELLSFPFEADSRF